MRLLEHFSQLVSLVLSDVDRVASVAVAVLAAVGWESGSPLRPRHLAQARLTLLAKRFHALATAPILDYKAIEFLSKAVLLDTSRLETPLSTLPLLPLPLRLLTTLGGSSRSCR